MSTTNNGHYFMAGDGEMAKLIREKDWSNTSLGTPDLWPQSLTTTLGIVLNSRFPMFLWWGPELTCFYNDAYRPSLGNDGKHSNILGKKGEEAWPEIWPIIQPLLQKILDGEGSTWSENQLIPFYRNGTIEDIYWTFSYSPVYDESGNIAGVMTICYETTEIVTSFKKLEESNNRYLSNILQAPTAMSIFRGENHIVEIANESMIQLWGKTAEDVLNKPLFEGLPEAKNQGFEDLLTTVYNTGEKFVAFERKLLLPRNGKIETIYVNFVYDALKDSDGTISGIVAIAIEVTAQVIARSRIEESEHKVRAIIANSPFPIAVYVGEDMIVDMANESIITIWGKGNDVLGKSFKDVLPEFDNQMVFEQIKNVYTTGIPFHTKHTPLDLVVDGKMSTYYFNYSLTPLYDSNGTIYAVMNTGVDVTDLNLANKKIEKSDRRFRNTVKQAPVAITILRSPEYIVEMANGAYLKLVDREEAEFLGKPLFESLPEAKQNVGLLLDNVFNSGIPFYGNDIPVQLNRFGKENISYFDFVYHPLKEESGEISGIMVIATEVTEKVEAQKITEQNQQRLNIIVEASELGTWELILKNKQPIYSKRYLEIVGGYPLKIELSQEQLLQHLHPQDIYIREKAFKTSLKSGHLNYEARVIWIDQSIHWVEVKGKVFYDKNRNPEKILGTARDITDEKKHQQELEESEQKFRLLADSMPQQVWTSDVEGNLNYFNQSVYKFSGLSMEEMDNGGWIQIIHPEDIDENIKKWRNAIATGEDFLVENRFRRYDGKYRWQLSRAVPQKDENGKIQMWVGTSTDIQDQKNSTDQLEKQVKERTKELILINESLEKSEERYHLMVDEIQDYAILYIDKNGIVENWNVGAQKIKGYKAEEIIGQNFAIFYTKSDQNDNLPQKLLSISKEKGTARQEGWRIRKNGTLFWANVLITAIRNKNKELIGFSKVTHDLTEKKKADDKLRMNGLELQEKNKELEKMNKELQSFAYISSHDLQEPLRKIQTFASQIIKKESENISDSGKDKLQRMQNAAKRMQALINDLLAYSKTNIHEIKFEKTNLSQIIEEVKEDLIGEVDQKNATIISDDVCDEIIVDIIPFQFRQILYNLLTNSIKFSRKDVPIQIEIKCIIAKGNTLSHNMLLEEGDYCHLEISDNGIGFEQEYGEKIFEVFQRLHGKSEYIGTGIGLAIVKKIVENHKGIIVARGELNKGATFDIYIPVI